jgi:enoyl-CoA hydratase/carnithine racemase
MPVHSQRQAGIVQVTLDRGATHAIDHQTITDLLELLKECAADREVRGLLLGSANHKFFSIGFDIPRLLEMTAEQMGRFYHDFNSLCLRLYTWPKPTVAAITGHAIAGGCILALCCDHRLIAEGRKLMGVNELKLGVPVPFLAQQVLAMVCGQSTAQEVVEGGELFDAARLHELGLVDRVVPLEQVQTLALARVTELGALPVRGFAGSKSNRVGVVTELFLRRRAEREQEFLSCWHSEEAQLLLREAAKKF